MKAVLAAAILYLAPHVPQRTAESYAEWIHAESARHQIDPLLVTAIIYRESRFRSRTVSKHNYGLTQFRVTRTCHSKWYGREREVLAPQRNIRLGVAELAKWRRYHQRRCGSVSGNANGSRALVSVNSAMHPWWAHYQFGIKVLHLRPAKRIDRVYQMLQLRFGTRRVPQS